MRNNEFEMNELYKKRINFLVTNSQTKKKYMDITRKMKKKCRKKWIKKLIIRYNKKLKVKKNSKSKCFKCWRQFFDEKVIKVTPLFHRVNAPGFPVSSICAKDLTVGMYIYDFCHWWLTELVLSFFSIEL